MKFEWDEAKNKTNIIKHGIPFETAQYVFYDENAIVVYDEEHSDDEERFAIIGADNIYRILMVCHCYRENDSIIRIISARKATNNEIEQYGGQL
ncbi:MAG: BrnT family toxin [Oscillospiraceae bacterium]|nr:BrnT family toxin [Oscillospiraceae bacterium]